MMTRKLLFTICTVLTFALVIWAADVTGKWTAQVPGRSGQMRDVTITLKADGQTLTGSITGRGGENPISEGKVSGDDLSFKVTTQNGTQTYTGKVVGSEIKFKREGGPAGPIEFTAKRAAT